MMGELSMALYLKQKRMNYKKANKQQKKHILDDFCKEHNYHRKAAIRLLNRVPHHEERSNKGGKLAKYDANKLLTPLKRIWLATDQMCSKRLKKAIPLWLPYYQEHYQQLSDNVYVDLLSI